MPERAPAVARRLTATLNFAASRADGGTWSNRDPRFNFGDRDARSVMIAGASKLDPRESLNREGFELIRQPWPEARWEDEQ